MIFKKLAAIKSVYHPDSETCEGCGQRVELQRIQGYPGEIFFKCPVCGHVDADIDEEIFDWMT